MSAWPTQPLVTERLLLRPWSNEDESAIVALKTGPDVRQWLDGPLHPEKALGTTRKQVAAVHWGHFVLVDAAEKSVVGPLTFDQRRGPWEVSSSSKGAHGVKD